MGERLYNGRDDIQKKQRLDMDKEGATLKKKEIDQNSWTRREAHKQGEQADEL